MTRQEYRIIQCSQCERTTDSIYTFGKETGATAPIGETLLSVKPLKPGWIWTDLEDWLCPDHSGE